MSEIIVGVDIENITKFKNLERKKNQSFLTKIFTKGEIEYCFEKINPSQHLAVRFAAKEAIIKAINSIQKNILTLNDIEVKNDFEGKPLVHIKKVGFSNMQFSLSLSHNDDNAIAFVAITNNQGLEKNE